MGLSIGIVGLPNVGKSTLFNALTCGNALVANYPFATIDANVGVVPVPDERLRRLGELLRSPKVVPATLQFVDIAGLVKGASKNEGLGNQFLAKIREVDAVLLVLRCFVDDNVSHVEGSVDPGRDKATVELELCLKDLETLDHRREKALRAAKAPGKEGEAARAEVALLERVRGKLNAGIPVRAHGLSAEERAATADWFLLTSKPVLYLANVSEGQLRAGDDDPLVARVRALAEAEGARVVVVAAALEAEVQQLPERERAEYLALSGQAVPGLQRVAQAAQALLGLKTFFTFNEKECHAWTFREGAKAPACAGLIHTDFERGFIKAEVIHCEELLGLGSEAAAKERGQLRIEGKDYTVRDGDCLKFRFNV